MKRLCSLAAALALSCAGAAWAAGASSSASDRSASSPGVTGTSPSGQAAGTSATMTEAQLVDRLQALGYTQVSEVDMEGGKYVARAMKGSQSVEVQFDPATGQVTERQGKGRSPG